MLRFGALKVNRFRVNHDVMLEIKIHQIRGETES